jgi:hypothetical protein
MDSRSLYQINDVNKLKTTTSKENKQYIKEYLQNILPNTKLSELFFNLGNSKKIFQNT